MAYIPFNTGGTGTATKPKSGGYTSYFGNTVQKTQVQGGNKPTTPKQRPLTNDEQVAQATAAGQKLGDTAKQPQGSSLFSKIKKVGKDIAVGTAQWAGAGVSSAGDIVRGAAASGDIPGTKKNQTALDNVHKDEAKNFPKFAAPLYKPVVQAAETVTHPGSHTFTPKTKDEKLILGDTPVQNVQAGVKSNYEQHPNLPHGKREALAAAYGAGQVAQDALGIVGLKTGVVDDAIAAGSKGKSLIQKRVVPKPTTPLPATETLTKPAPPLNTVPQAVMDEHNAKIATEQAVQPQPGAVITPEHPATPIVKQHLVESYKPGSDHPDEKFAADYLHNNTSQALHDYQARTEQIFGSKNIVGGDDAKYSIPGMAADKSVTYHEPASELAKGYYKHLLSDTETTHKPVMITAGGTGAGKTSALKKKFNAEGIDPNDYAAIVDTNLTTLKSATSRIEPALATGRPVEVQFVYRDPVEAFKNGVIPRAVKEGRAVTAGTHADTHANSLDTIKQLADKYQDNPNVTVKIIDNSRGSGKSASVPLDFLHDKVYTKSEIEEQIHELLDNHLKEGKLTHEQHTTFKGQTADQTIQSPKQSLDKNGSDVRPVERDAKPQAVKQPEQPSQTRQVDHTPGNSRVYERLQAEHPELDGKVQYTPIKLQEEADKAAKLIETDKQKAFRIAMGAEQSDSITSTATNIAMSEKALADGNMKLYAQLTKNRSLAQTRRGQEIVSEKASVTDNSTSRYVKELIASRLDKLGKNYLHGVEVGSKTLGKGKSKGIAAIDKEVAKAQKKLTARTIDINDAQSILDRITC